jgi:membrane-associated phospholipid phosphatase
MTSHPWRRAITISVAGLVLAAVVGALFALLVQSQGDWRVGLPWERALMLSIDRTVPTFIDWIMLSLPWLGTNLTLFPIVAAVSLWLWRKKGRGELALQLMVVVVGSLLLNVALKNVFDRPRPELWEHRGQYAWASYPSGHAIVGVAAYFTIARMLLRERGWRWPFVAATLMLAIVLYSRLYLGVHWPTDVIGGIVLGVVWLVVVELAFRPQRGKRNQTDALPVDSAVPCPVGHHAHQEA